MQSKISLNDAISTNRASGSKNVTIPALRDTFVLLRTAIPMTEAECATAQANVAFAQSEISLLNQESLNTEYISMKRKSRLKELRRFEQLERGLLAPIRKLSMEVLQIILQLAHYYSYDDGSIFSLIASQVCSYWRITALSTPSIWTDISFRFTSNKIRYGKLVEYCLQYSKEMPLSLSFESAIVEGPELLGDSCVQALGQDAHRWQDVNFEQDFATVIFAAIPEDVILENLEGLRLDGLYNTEITIKATPKLSGLYLGCYAWTSDDSNDHVTIEYAPNLTHLTLNYMHQPSTAITGLDWSLIKRFEARHINFEPHELNHILEHMPNLLYLVLDCEMIGIMSNITLSHIQFLSVKSIGEDDILSVLTTPRLKGLHIWNSFNEDPLTKTMVEFARRSKFRLEELTVCINDIDESWLIPEFTSVKKLVLDCLDSMSVNQESTWRRIKRLTFKSEPSPNDIFPMLESLVLQDLHAPPQNTEWAVTTLVDMLKSRLACLGQTRDVVTRGYLKYVHVRFTSALSVQDGNICSEFVQSELVRNSGADLRIRDAVHHNG